MNVYLPAVMNLPWRADAAEFWFSHINHLPWAMLLHSGYTDHFSSRFDILVADPLITLTTQGDTTLIKDNEIRISMHDPIAILEQALCDSGITAYPDPNLPFLGGAVGIFGYDLVRRFEKLPSNAKDDITLPSMAVGIYDWALIVDHQSKLVTLISHSDLYTRLDWLKSQCPIAKEDFFLTSPWCSNMKEEDYAEKFQKIQEYLQNGDCYQINLAQRFQATYKGDEWQAFCHLNISNRAPFSAFLHLENGVVLSLSPERFIHLSNGVIQTRPIKGTLPRLLDRVADQQQIKKLAASQKDRAENLMIVDLMRNDLGRVSVPGSVQVPEMFIIESYPAVHHMVSSITAKLLPSYSACDLLRAVFPGGSITGAPKVRAMEIIDELEPHRRNAWCGSISYLSVCGTMDSNIAIRTLIAYNNQIYCSAGSGIVADSEAQFEYRETFDKVNIILQQLEKVNH